MLRREKDPTDALMRELLTSIATQLTCPCGHEGMLTRPVEDELDDVAWGSPRRCTACGAVIPAERVELYPDVELCVACQRVEEQGRSADDPEFCPRCGSVLEMQTRRVGISRYQLVCPVCRR
jgi:RNA polymerase-binding transcription factor DksA